MNEPMKTIFHHYTSTTISRHLS